MNAILAHDQTCSARHPHTVQLYHDDETLVTDVSDFVCASLTSGAPAIVVGTPEHRDKVDTALASVGIDVARARAEGRYVVLDAAETLAAFMDGERVDEARFATVIGGLLRQTSPLARTPAHRTGVYGEMVALLASERRFAAALDLERHWNLLTHRHRFSLLCGYPAQVFGRPEDISALFDICDAHTDVITAEASGPDGTMMRPVDVLQQRAHLLDHQTAHGAPVSVAGIRTPTPSGATPPSLETIVRSLRVLIGQHSLPLLVRIAGDRVIATSRGTPWFELSVQADTAPIDVLYRGWLPDEAGATGTRWQPLWRLLALWGTERSDFRPTAPAIFYPDLIDHML